MFQILKTNPLAAAIAIGMHLVIILLMVFGLDWLEKPKPDRFKANVVQATVIDASKVDAEVKKLKLADENKKKKEEAAKLKEKKHLDDLKKKRQAEEKRLADLKKKRQAEEKKKLELEKENKRKAAEAKKREAEEKKRKAAAEKKRKAAEEKKRKAEAERKRKLEEQRKLEAQMRADMEAERDATEIELYMAKIQQTVEDSWLRPSTVGDGLKCTLRIRMAAGGNVIAAQVVQSSGNSAFDRSAEAAVRKADPLPVPSGRLFEKFRDINFVFAPRSGE